MNSSNIPRPEHPRPQFYRDDWRNLNGEWTYTFDFGCSGMDKKRELFNSTGFSDKITVPFCPESELSGVGHKDFIPALWYHRTIKIPEKWDEKRILLHFGAVDYECEAFIDGTSAGTHFGGAVSFTFDITHLVTAEEEHNLVVRVKDDTRGGNQPGGKQSHVFESRRCHYTRTTGIWQTVWLEAAGKNGLRDVQIIPNFDDGKFTLIPRYYDEQRGYRLIGTALAGGKTVSTAEVSAANGVSLTLTFDEPRAWSVEDPFLYDIDLKVADVDYQVVDHVSSYAGLRKVHIEGNRVYLNNEPIFQRLVLDQGFYPEGIWTAPSDAALKNDILLAQKAGFNGARLHQKVFEERFHYWADKLGYLTWGESASWGCDYNTIEGARNFISEWQEIIVRDRNHPSIITWTPWNESGDYHNPKQHRRLHADTYNICKDLDPTRPVNDASGYLHHVTDVWTVHTYEQSPEKLQELLSPRDEEVFRNKPEFEAIYRGQPYVVDEFGGIKWIPRQSQEFADNSWGYGDDPKTVEEFYRRLKGLTDVLFGLDHVCGFCYTQLTDVEQEQNGIYNYDRTRKFDMDRINAIFSSVPCSDDSG